MKARHKRIALILGGLAALGIIAAFVLNALNDNMAFFYSPSDVKNGKAPQNKVFRIGGLVEAGSLNRQGGRRHPAFRGHRHRPGAFPCSTRDSSRPVPEGKGVVAQGVGQGDGNFTASEVLAKHDENYMPPEAAKALEKAHQEGTGNADAKTVTPQAATPPALKPPPPK